jgi:hypothetical protein
MRYVLLLFFFGAIAHAEDRTHFVSGLVDGGSFDESFDFQTGSPVEFLTVLKGATKGMISVRGFHHGWIREEDVADLIPLMSSEEPCRAVISTFSSHRIPNSSTVGHEASLLIDGYRKGRYPSFLSSDRELRTSQEQWDLQKWCDEFMAYWQKRVNKRP